MTTLMRSAAVAAVGLFVALGTVGCDDTGGGGGGNGGSTTTTSTVEVTTTTAGEVTTTTQGVVTTTTQPGSIHLECTLTWRVQESSTFGALQFDTDYSQAGGEFGTRTTPTGSVVVDCTNLTTGSLAAFNDKKDQQVLSSAFANQDPGITGPTDVMTCKFNTPPNDETAPVAGDFAISVTDSTDIEGNPLTATMQISNISCVPVVGPPVTTSTSSTSTTTLPPSGATYVITFQLTNSVTLGGLQWDAEYGNAPGGFATRTTPTGSVVVDCTNLSTGSLAAFNDKKDLVPPVLSVALANQDPGITGPSDVVNCRFNADAGATPQPSDFQVSVVDSVDLEGNPLSGEMNVTVTPQAP